MDDQLDDNLKKRIKEVFDNFGDASADEGWLRLREKFPEKVKRRPAIWLWASSIAALLLLFVGVLLFRPATNTNQHLTNNKKHPGNNLTPKTPEHKNDSMIASVTPHQLNKNIADQSEQTNPVLKKDDHQSPGKQSLAAPLNNKNTVVTDNSGEVAAIRQSKTQNQDAPTGKSVIGAKIDTSNIVSSKTLAATNAPSTNVVSPGIVTQQKIVAATGSGTQQQPAANDKPVYASNEPKKSAKTRDYDRSVHFGAYATSFFNYARGSSSQLNVGAGISSDIRLSKKLRLSTGIAITQNSLNYATPSVGAPTPQASKANYLVANAFSVQDNFTIPNAITRNNSAATLVGLDIPVNLTYMFNPQKSSTYISAGLSSGTYVNEKYKFNYSYSSSFATQVVGLPEQSRKSFNSFYFAKTLNFSFGKAVRVGNNRVIVEPFIKYPLEGLGAQQIRFGSSGVNLKFNFFGQK